MCFVLKGNLNWRLSPEYYKGKTYQYDGEIYPEVSVHLKEAKVYKSKKVAERSCKILNDKISSEHEFEVMEVEKEINTGKLQKEEISKIDKLLAGIIQSKEDICEIVNRNCKVCPLNVDDKCSELDLPEFDYNKFQWIDDTGVKKY